MPHLGLGEILIIVLILVIIFGAGKIAKLGGELGSGIKAFKDGLQGKGEENAETVEEAKPEDKA